MRIYPSIASSDVLALRDSIRSLEDWKYMHIDIEDGNFTPNITFGMKTVKAACKEAKGKEIHAHLMANHPETYLDELKECGIHTVTAHIEALDFPMLFLNRCHALGMKAGLALNMKTPIEDTEMFWPLMDQLLVMTSEPDYAGEKLYGPAFERALKCRAILPKHIEIIVDGGLTEDALKKLSAVGTDGVVLGRLAFGGDCPRRTLGELMENL